MFYNKFSLDANLLPLSFESILWKRKFLEVRSNIRETILTLQNSITQKHFSSPYENSNNHVTIVICASYSGMFIHAVRSLHILGYVFMIAINPVYSESRYQSLTVISSQSYQYSPVVLSAQLISSTIMNSAKLCAMACNTNPLCRVFDYGDTDN